MTSILEHMQGHTSDNRLYLLGQRFIDPAVESSYQCWRQGVTFSAMWLGTWSAFFSFAGLLLAYSWVAPELYAETRAGLIGFVLPLIFLHACAGFVHSFRVHMRLASITIHLISSLVMVWMYWIKGDSIAGAAIGVVIVAFYAPFMRHSPIGTMISCAPAIIFISVIASTRKVELGEAAWFVMTFGLIIALATVVMVCAVLEYFLRISYTREMLIESQAAQLSSAAKQVRRYVPAAVAERILAGDGDKVDHPERRRLTVLFADLQGFTSLADRVDPESFTEIVNDYMRAMSEIVEQYGGTLNEFAGDGIMALFGAPAQMPPREQVKNALAAAQKMQQKLPEMNRSWRKLGSTEDVALRVGINSGVLSVGSFGSEGRMTYTAIGLQTNIAARIQSHAQPGEILLSETSYSLLEDRQSIAFRGEIHCKGVHFPVKTYVVGAEGSTGN